MIPILCEFTKSSFNVHLCLAFILLHIINVLLSNKSAVTGNLLSCAIMFLNAYNYWPQFLILSEASLFYLIITTVIFI